MNPNDLSRPHVWQPSGDVANSKTFLLLHGSGADEHDLLTLGKALDPNANLLSPRGLVKLDGANRFFIRFDDGRFDEPGIVKNSTELANFLWVAAGEYGFNPDNVYAVGFSNGANAAGAMMLLQPDSLSGVVAFGTNKSFEKTPFTNGKPNLVGKRIWIANGRADAYSPSERVEAMIAEYESLGASVKYMLHNGGHNIVREHVQAIAEDLQ